MKSSGGSAAVGVWAGGGGETSGNVWGSVTEGGGAVSEHRGPVRGDVTGVKSHAMGHPIAPHSAATRFTEVSAAMMDWGANGMDDTTMSVPDM